MGVVSFNFGNSRFLLIQRFAARLLFGFEIVRRLGFSAAAWDVAIIASGRLNEIPLRSMIASKPPAIRKRSLPV